MKTILVIEDDPDLIKPIQIKLEKAGLKIITAINGKDGWEKLEQNDVDCIILDVVMPETDGVWFLEHLRASELKSKTPVIVFTNLAEGEKVAKVVSLGAYRLLVKADTSMEELVNTIREVLRVYANN